MMERIESELNLRDYDIQTQIKDMDFDNYNPITNLGGLFMVILLLVVEFAGVFILKLVVKYLKRVRAKQKFEASQHEGGESNKSESRFKRKAK